MILSTLNLTNICREYTCLERKFGGVIGMSTFVLAIPNKDKPSSPIFVTNECNFQELFPNIKLRIGTLNLNFAIPLWREMQVIT